MIPLLIQTIAVLELTVALLRGQVAQAAVQIEPTRTERAIALLEQCESGGDYSIRVLDVNGKYSYGGLQFQLDTFWRYGMKYGVFGGTQTKEHAKKFLYSEGVQRQIAKRMIDDDWDNLYHWKNCAVKNGLID